MIRLAAIILSILLIHVHALAWTIDRMENPTSIDGMANPTSIDGMTVSSVVGYEGYWLFENDLTDDSGNGLTLTALNGPLTYESGSPLEGSYSLDLEYTNTEAAYVSDASLGSGFPSASASSIESFTVLAIIKPESVGGGVTHYIASKYATTGDKRSWAIQINGTSEVSVLMGNTNGTAYDAYQHLSNLSAGTTYGIGFSYDGDSSNTLRIHVYNIGTSSTVGSDLVDTHADFCIEDSDLYIGGRDGSTATLDGLIDKLEIFVGVLTPTEMDQHFEGVLP